MALAYLLLVLGSAAAFPNREMEREDKRCKEFFFPTDTYDDDKIEDCLLSPDIAAVADGFTGTEADKRLEIGVQCAVKRQFDSFTGGVLDPDKFKQYSEQLVKGEAFEASVKPGIDDCFSILQQPYQLVAYLRCVADYC